MKKTCQLLFILFGLSFNTINAQIVDPVKWTFTTHKINSCEVELIFQAKIENSWHLYGQKSYGGEGPVPTSFHFTKNHQYQLIGKISEKNLVKEFEPVWGFELEYFVHQATFKQKVKIQSDKAFEIKGNLEFMVCTDVTCLPPTLVDFSFKLDGADCLDGKNMGVTTNAAPCVCDTFAIAKAYGLAHNKFKEADFDTPKTSEKIDNTASDTNTTTVSKKNNWRYIILGFIAILIILFFLNKKRKK